jgi:hypothetical protein
MSVLRDAIAEAMRVRTDESPSIKSKMEDVAEAVAAVKRDLIGTLPRMRRSGRTDVSDLAVSVNALPPAGTMKGTVLYMAPDFDAPLEDFEQASGA